MQNRTRIEKIHRIRRTILFLILFMAILSVGGFFLLNSNIFNITEIKILGNNKLDKEEIIRRSQINKAESIFNTRISRAIENISKLPYIKEVEIRRSLPQTIEIQVTEREGKILLKNISMYILIDDEGYILEKKDIIAEELPVLTGLKLIDIHEGDNIFAEIEQEEIIDLIKEGNRLNLLGKIDEINVDSIDDIEINLNSGIDVAFGTLDNVKYKLDLLDEILKDIENKGINCKKIIMNNDSHPIIIVDD